MDEERGEKPGHLAKSAHNDRAEIYSTLAFLVLSVRPGRKFENGPHHNRVKININFTSDMLLITCVRWLKIMTTKWGAMSCSVPCGSHSAFRTETRMNVGSVADRCGWAGTCLPRNAHPLLCAQWLPNNYQLCSGLGLRSQGECRTAQTNILKATTSPSAHLAEGPESWAALQSWASSVVAIHFPLVVPVQGQQLLFVEGQIENNLGFGWLWCWRTKTAIDNISANGHGRGRVKLKLARGLWFANPFPFSR